MELLAADGSILRFQSDSALDVSSWYQFVHLTTTSSVRRDIGLNVAPVDMVDSTLKLIDGVVVERRRHSGGDLVLVRGSHNRVPVVGFAWIGPWNCVHAQCSSPEEALVDVLAQLAGVEFSDSPDGLIIHAPMLKWERHFSSRFAQELGFLSFKRLSSRSDLPKGAGAAVPVGEVWRAKGEAGSGERLLVASNSVLLDLTPIADDEGPAALPQQAVDFAGSITELSWNSN